MRKNVAFVVVAGLALAFSLAACKDQPSSLETAATKPGESDKEAKSHIKVIKTPVAPGTKIPCEKIFDPAKVGAALGKDVVIKAASTGDKDANAVCRVMLAGEPPTKKEQEKMWMKNNRVLGVLPGDEICQVTLYCSFPVNKEDKRKRCEAQGKMVKDDVGQLACVQIVQAGAEDRYVYEVIDDAPACTYLINPGPSVTGDDLPKQCAKMAVDLITPESVKVN